MLKLTTYYITSGKFRNLFDSISLSVKSGFTGIYLKRLLWGLNGIVLVKYNAVNIKLIIYIYCWGFEGGEVKTTPLFATQSESVEI